MPTTDAGIDQSVDELTSVTLSGTVSDTDGTIARTQWSQVSGTPVTITNANALTATAS